MASRYASRNITSEAGRAIQAGLWKEILDVLEQAVPEVKTIVHSMSK